ncbi:MAG: metallopeptidase family protein, partial [Planctomycetes bacterium]|nr:metallopeptidase family protein [Planctomycetota bacterium]
YLAGFLAVRNPDRFRGLVIASARLKHEFLEEELEAGEELPNTLFLHSRKDKSTPWERTKQGLDLLEKAGAHVTHYLHDDGHRLPPDAVVKITEWLGQRGFDRGRQEAAQIQSAWRALEDGHPERALELIREHLTRPEETEAWLVAAASHLELEEFPAAADLLERLGQRSLDGDTEYLRRSYLGQALYFLGRPSEALDAIAPLEPQDPIERANLEWWMGLCHDHLGKSMRADEHFQRAQRLDPQGAPAPLEISIDEVEEIVAEVSESLPGRLGEVFEEVPVVVQDLPPRDVIRKSEGRLHPDTLGLYSGSSLIDRSVFNTAEFPPTIYIYRRNLERFATSPEDLREQVRVTLLHELGHHLGYDEEDLDQLGLA